MEKKYVCLSFDDGPNNTDNDNTMEQMLDVLEKHNVPASFFLVGNKITEQNIPTIKRAMKLGCDIQNHSWSHNAMAEMTDEQVQEEFKKCEDKLVEVTGRHSQFFRPPYISVSETMYKNLHVPFICGLGCLDWEPERDAEYRYNGILKNTTNGTIYLLHVMEHNKPTVDAVDKAIPEIKKMGYEFVNLLDLFEKLNINPEMPHSLWAIANGQQKGNTWPQNQ